MEFFKETHVPFMRFRFICGALSLALIIMSFVVWFQKGEAKYGVDFLGGTEVVVRFPDQVRAADIRARMREAGFGTAIVQAFEGDAHEFSIRLKASGDAETAKQLKAALQPLAGEGQSLDVLKEDFVGPVIGDQIRSDGITSLAIALICILIYISVRFEWRFAVGAIVALMHDIIITTGIFVLSGREISAAVLAALLTIIGYSLNDTIIVFDRVRENFNRVLSGKKGPRGLDKRAPFVELVDASINQTLSRTTLTSATTLFVCVSLWLFGGGAIADLAFALVVGIMVGTYSSIFIACVAVVALDRDFGKKKERALEQKVA